MLPRLDPPYRKGPTMYPAVGLSLGISFLVNYMLYQRFVFTSGQAPA
jgi:hypothetical protein